MTGEGASLPSCPHSIFYELMDFTVILSEKSNVLPFKIFKQDKDEVIMLINYYIQKGESENTPVEKQSAKDDFWDF